MSATEHYIRFWADGDTFADMEEMKAMLTRMLNRKVTTRLAMRIVMKYALEGHKNQTFDVFVSKMRFPKEFEFA